MAEAIAEFLVDVLTGVFGPRFEDVTRAIAARALTLAKVRRDRTVDPDTPAALVAGVMVWLTFIVVLAVAIAHALAAV